jgi:excisionase family DNA binding protein
VSSDILNVEQAAELLQLTPPTVRQMASRRIIPGRKLGGKYWRFSTRQLFAWVRNEPIGPSPTTAPARRRSSTKSKLSAPDGTVVAS